MNTARRRASLLVPCCVLALAAFALTLGCAGTRTLADPTLEIRSAQGVELGVSTDYGVVFLGQHAQAGNIEVTAWYGDGPDIEVSVVEPVGAGLYTAETEIRLPQVPLSFDDPAAGSQVLVIGRNKHGLWQRMLTVKSDQRVLGILLPSSDELSNAGDQIGAGVYVLPDGDEHKKRLVGLVSGRIRLTTDDGEREFVTVVGPQDLWRLVAYRRDRAIKRRWVYREDIL